MAKRFGERLRARRLEMGFKKQEDLGTALGVDQPMVSRWERETHSPSEPYIEKLMDLLKVEKSFFENDHSPATTSPTQSEIAMVHLINKNIQLEAKLQSLKLTDQEQDLLDLFRQATDSLRELVIQTLSSPGPNKPQGRARRASGS